MNQNLKNKLIHISIRVILISHYDCSNEYCKNED